MEKPKEDLKFWIVVAVACLAVLPVAFFTSYYLNERRVCGGDNFLVLILLASLFGAMALLYFGLKRFSGWKKGAALVVGVFLLAALFFFPLVFMPFSCANPNVAYWQYGSSPFSIPEYTYGNSSFSFVISNSVNNSVTFKGITFHSNATTFNSSTLFKLEPGEKKVVNIMNISSCVRGLRYSYDVNITYSDENGEKTQVGAKPLIVICA